MKNRVTGIGGFFFKADDPDNLKDWYKKRLGIPTDQYGWSFKWRKDDDPEQRALTQWSPFDASTAYFKPSQKQFMFNFRVENLEELLEVLKEEGVTVIGSIEKYSYGKFGWILDPEGNKIELWEPVDEELL
ncbi:VOC family protein [Zhouia amylolytica]|uniref:Glyoxalase/bleomycin resistance protein/dioxygenase n=1 Tax=Zhouia amylolytica AD3 TaxID=1286632 RepID=W2ULW4_9FLAO|nr:VOC family protein [Zhouia amylolytica]ETN94292.1 glyoxalase/bleomycin resistance protein/dioxygenase [Zhouia amylolytica AD3]